MTRSITTIALAGMFLALTALGCGGFNSSESQIVQEDNVSECGGFGVLGQPLLDGSPSYCGAEMLYWQYEADTQTLRLANTRVFLNCCGEHSMTLEEIDGLFVITELDEPEKIPGYDEGARCGCMCVFDYTLEAQGVAQDIIQLKLVRVVSDWEEASGDVFEGEIDLTAGTGSIVISDEDIGDWCHEPTE